MYASVDLLTPSGNKVTQANAGNTLYF